MAAAAPMRWGALRSIATAFRTATRAGTPGMGERLGSVPRLVKATLKGEYVGTTRRRLLLLAGAVAYVVSPIDLIPEAIIPIIGFGDDAVVVSWIAASLINETEQFLSWERRRKDTVPGDVLR